MNKFNSALIHINFTALVMTASMPSHADLIISEILINSSSITNDYTREVGEYMEVVNLGINPVTDFHISVENSSGTVNRWLNYSGSIQPNEIALFSLDDLTQAWGSQATVTSTDWQGVIGSGLFSNTSGGSIRIATGEYLSASSGSTLAEVDGYSAGIEGVSQFKPSGDHGSGFVMGSVFEYSVAGEYGAYNSTISGIFNGVETGSPGYIEGLSAVPIPAAVWLFGSGLIGLIGIARRKKV